VGEILAQVLDAGTVKYAAVMRAVQDALGAIQPDAQPRARELLDVGTEMPQQRLDFPPMDVAADGIVKQRAEQVFLLVALGTARAWWQGLDCLLWTRLFSCP
jgi:hypothetical protein